MSDYDEGYRAGMQKMREVGQSRIEELSNCVAVLEAKLSKSEALLAKAVEGLRDAAEDMDGYVGKGYGDLYGNLAEELTNTEKRTRK